MKFTPFALSVLATVASAAPTSQHVARDGAVTITQDQILQIMPKAACCNGADPADECLTAKKAVDPLNKVFATYKITSAAEQAAVVSLMALESGEFRYNKNHFPAPGRPGQGTRNMQMPAFNLKYAQSIDAIKDKLDPIVNGATDGAALSDDQKKNMLSLLTGNEEYSLGSAAWFLTTQCSADVRSALQKGTDDGWSQYITTCVGTTVTDDRKAYWTKAKTALKVT